MQEPRLNRPSGALSASASHKIQILRGLAIVAVVFIHNTPAGISQVVIRPFLNFCVGLFLFFSGMLSSATHWGPVKRIVKVLIPYGIWSLIYIIAYEYRTPLHIPVSFLKSLILGNASAVMYYIFVYCAFTLLIPLIDRLARSKYRYWGFVIAPAEILLMRLLPSLLGFQWNKYVSALLSVSFLGWFTYYYLGYLLGNKLIDLSASAKKLFPLWCVSMVLQIAEGWLLYSLGNGDCGSQLKLTALLSGVLFALLAYRFIFCAKEYKMKALKLLGDLSFGIYFSHLFIMLLLEKIPGYTRLAPYPLNAVAAVLVSALLVYLGRKLLGKYSKYLAL